MTNEECDGWDFLSHKTDAGLSDVFVPGCARCGGSECGDYGELLHLCPACLADFSRAYPSIHTATVDKE